MGREETIDYCVPISRLKQHRQEVARLLPGLKRTDEPVFNVPRLGKSRPGARQDHVVIMILPDGRRIYWFYSRESPIFCAQPSSTAAIPPCANQEWERKGYTFEITATSTSLQASKKKKSQ